MRDSQGRLFTLEVIQSGDYFELWRKYPESESHELMVTTVSYYLLMEIQSQILRGEL